LTEEDKDKDDKA
jgi:hypothetical protein